MKDAGIVLNALTTRAFGSFLAVGSAQEKPTATVTAREFIEYLEGMATMERRDEERRDADRDALCR